MNDNNTIYIVTDGWQRYERNYQGYMWATPTITWEDMAWTSRTSNNYTYDYLRNYNPITCLSDIYNPYKEKQILSFYYVNCDDA